MKSLSIASILTVLCLAFPVEPSAGTEGLVLTTAIQEVPQSSCLSRDKAEEEAGSLALKSAQTYCRSEGFGWRAASIKELGNLDCHRCDSGKVSCGYTRVSLECRKAEPRLTWIGRR